MANLAKEKRFVKVFNMIRMAIALKDSLEMGKEVVMELYYRVMATYIRDFGKMECTRVGEFCMKGSLVGIIMVNGKMEEKMGMGFINFQRNIFFKEIF